MLEKIILALILMILIPIAVIIGIPIILICIIMNLQHMILMISNFEFITHYIEHKLEVGV